MNKPLYFKQTSGSNHKALSELESYLDNSPELIPHSTHSDLVGIFDRMNDVIFDLVEAYENRIAELESELKELEENHA